VQVRKGHIELSYGTSLGKGEGQRSPSTSNLPQMVDLPNQVMEGQENGDQTGIKRNDLERPLNQWGGLSKMCPARDTKSRQNVTG